MNNLKLEFDVLEQYRLLSSNDKLYISLYDHSLCLNKEMAMEKTINVNGMHCTSCEFLIKDSLNDLGVRSRVDYKKGEVVVDFDPKKVGVEKIYKAIEDNGYKVIK